MKIFAIDLDLMYKINKQNCLKMKKNYNTFYSMILNLGFLVLKKNYTKVKDLKTGGQRHYFKGIKSSSKRMK